MRALNIVNIEEQFCLKKLRLAQKAQIKTHQDEGDVHVLS